MQNITVPKRAGRKAIHASPAARAAAYRARKAESIAAVLAQLTTPDPAVLEALQAQLAASQEQLRLTQSELASERDLSRQRERDRAMPQRIKASNTKNRTSADARLAVLGNYFVDGAYPRVGDAKRLRVNVKKAASAATELLSILKGLDFDARKTIEGDIEALDSAFGLLSNYGNLIETMQRSAESKKAHKIAVQNKAHEEQVRVTIAELFPNAESKIRDVTKIAEDLIKYKRDGEAWLSERRHTERANTHIEKGYDLRQAFNAKNNAARPLDCRSKDRDAETRKCV